MKIKMFTSKIFLIAGKSTLYGYLNSLFVFFQLSLIYKNLNNETLNGLWLTIFSVISWVYLLDFGISNSLRNLLIGAYKEKNSQKYNKILTTGLIISTAIFTISFILFSLIIINLNWNSIFNISPKTLDNNSIRQLLIISLFFTIIKVNLNVFNSVFNTTNKNHWINLILMTSTIISVISLFLLKFIEEANFFVILLIVTSTPTIVSFIFIIHYLKNNNNISLSLKNFDFRYVKTIFSPGVMFLMLQLFSLLFYSTDTFLITSLISPSSVNNFQYSIKIFGIVTLFFSALLNPLWTEVAKLKKEKEEINSKIKTMIAIFSLFSFLIILLNFFMKDLIQVITGEPTQMNQMFLLLISIFIILQMWCSLFQAIANALNILFSQVLYFGIGALLNIPLSLFMFKNILNNESGIVLGTILSLLIPSIFIPIKIYKNFSN